MDAIGAIGSMGSLIVFESSSKQNRRVRPSSAIRRGRSAVHPKAQANQPDNESPIISPIIHVESSFDEQSELGIVEDTDEADDSEFEEVLENYFKGKSSHSPSSESDSSPKPVRSTPQKLLDRPKSAKLDTFNHHTPLGKHPPFLSLGNISKISADSDLTEANQSIQSMMSEILGNRTFRRRPSSAELVRPSSAPPVQQDKVKDAIRQLWNLSSDSLAKFTSRPSTATTRNHRPSSATARNEPPAIEKASTHIPTKPLHNLTGRIYFDETNMLEKKIYEANCAEKIRLANDFCLGLTLPYRWEFKIAEQGRNQYRAILYKNDVFVKEVSMELFQRDYDKLRRDRIQAHKEHKSVNPSIVVKESKERHYEKFELDRKAANKALIHETQSLISALENQIQTLS